MEELLQNSAVLLVIVTLLYVIINGLTMHERMRVMLIYIFSFVLALAGAFSLEHIAVGSVVVLFLALEFLTDDAWRLQLFSRLDYKMLDFLYRMGVEYAYAPFLLSLASVWLARLEVGGIVTACAYVAAVLLMMATLFSLTAKKYATKSVSEIIETLEQTMLAHQLKMTPQLTGLFAILSAVEDRAYFERKDQQHTVPLARFIQKGITYMKGRSIREWWQAFRSLFRRGYGTIEMQLLRSIGIEYGYQYTVRRKLFELIYANMIFNGYRMHLIRGRGDYHQYRAFIMRQYIEHVDVSINGTVYRPFAGRSSLLRLFGEKKIAAISREQFLVWCMGLPQRALLNDEIASYYYGDVMRRFSIDQRAVSRIIRSL